MILSVLISRSAFIYSAAVSLIAPPSTSTNKLLVSSQPPSFGNAAVESSKSSPFSDANGPNDTDYDNSGISEQAREIRSKVSLFLDERPEKAGPLVRLAFHDATTLERSAAARFQNRALITGGPNASIRYELERSQNRALSRPLEFVTSLWEQQQQQSKPRPFPKSENTMTLAAETVQQHEKREEEATSPRLSLADVIALAGSEAIHHAGGPFIPIRLGRTDQAFPDPVMLHKPLRRKTVRSRVETTLPSPGLDSDGLRLYFRRLGLSEAEFVALSGAHGMGRHVSLLGMPKACLKNLTRPCLEDAPVLLPFVTSSVDKFDNSYFLALLRWNSNQVELGEVAFIPTDVALVVDQGLRRHVVRFAKDAEAYSRTFATAYQKLVETTATSRRRY